MEEQLRQSANTTGDAGLPGTTHRPSTAQTASSIVVEDAEAALQDRNAEGGMEGASPSPDEDLSLSPGL